MIRLIREGVLLKFYKALPTNLYFVVYKQNILMLSSTRGILRPIRIMHGLIFDVNNGFTGRGQSEMLDKLNEFYQTWMKAGNIDRPILPANVIHL